MKFLVISCKIGSSEEEITQLNPKKINLASALRLRPGNLTEVPVFFAQIILPDISNINQPILSILCLNHRILTRIVLHSKPMRWKRPLKCYYRGGLDTVITPPLADRKAPVIHCKNLRVHVLLLIVLGWNERAWEEWAERDWGVPSRGFVLVKDV